MGKGVFDTRKVLSTSVGRPAITIAEDLDGYVPNMFDFHDFALFYS